MNTSLLDLVDEINDIAEKYVKGAQEVLPEDLGLDRRAAYRLWVTDDAIIVPKQNDSKLQYYGGFEYVDKDCRFEIGDWVMYSSDDSRVYGHLERFQKEDEDEEDVSPY